MEDPRSKIQDPEKHQSPSSMLSPGDLEFGAWIFPGSWCLVLGSSVESPQTIVQTSNARRGKPPATPTDLRREFGHGSDANELPVEFQSDLPSGMPQGHTLAAPLRD